MGSPSDKAFILAIPVCPPSIDRRAVEIEARRTMFFLFTASGPDEYREIALQTRWLDEHDSGSENSEVVLHCYGGVIEVESCSR